MLTKIDSSLVIQKAREALSTLPEKTKEGITNSLEKAGVLEYVRQVKQLALDIIAAGAVQETQEEQDRVLVDGFIKSIQALPQPQPVRDAADTTVSAMAIAAGVLLGTSPVRTAFFHMRKDQLAKKFKALPMKLSPQLQFWYYGISTFFCIEIYKTLYKEFARKVEDRTYASPDAEGKKNTPVSFYLGAAALESLAVHFPTNKVAMEMHLEGKRPPNDSFYNKLQIMKSGFAPKYITTGVNYLCTLGLQPIIARQLPGKDGATKEVVAGGTAGFVSSLITHPLDSLTKNAFLQTREKDGKIVTKSTVSLGKDYLKLLYEDPKGSAKQFAKWSLRLENLPGKTAVSVLTQAIVSGMLCLVSTKPLTNMGFFKQSPSQDATPVPKAPTPEPK